jgi:hypothetical protein
MIFGAEKEVMLTGSRAKCPDAGWLGTHGLDAAFNFAV